MEDSAWFSHYSTFEEDRGETAPFFAQSKDPRFLDDSQPVYSRDLILRTESIGEFRICDWGEDRWPKGRRVENRSCDQFPTLHFVIDGKGTLNGTPLRAGTAFLIDPKIPYSMTGDAESPLCYCWMRVRVEDSFFRNLNLFTFGEDGCGRFDFSPCLQDVIRLHRKGQRLTGDGLFLSLSLNSLFFEIICRCLSAAPHRKEPSHYVERALEYIRANYAENINVNLLAEKLHISRAHLRRLFLRDLGRLPKEQIEKCRIEAAITRLERSPAIPLSQIAAEVGYPSYSQFIHAFRRVCGCSPKEYRETTK